jgi:hypothetical protein
MSSQVSEVVQLWSFPRYRESKVDYFHLLVPLTRIDARSFDDRPRQTREELHP